MLLRELAKDLPGRRKWVKAGLAFELSRANVAWVFARLPAATYDNPARLNEVLALEQMEDEARRAKTVDLPPEAGAFPFKTKPRPHQLKTFMLSRDREAYGYFLEQGLGKTKVTLDNSAHLWAEGKIDTLLVVAPNNVHAQWIEEQVPLHLPDWVAHVDLIYQSYQPGKWLKLAEAAMAYTGGLRIIAMHQEAFATPKGIAFAKRVLTSGRVMWALDESVGIKNAGSKRTKAIMLLRKLAAYRRILTGTPVTKGIEDLYTQLKFLHDDVHGFSSFWSFRNHYCETVPNPFARGAVRIVGYKNVDELKRRMDAWCMRLTVDECLDLPPRTYIQRPVALTDEQKRLYTDLRDLHVAALADGTHITTDQAVTRMLRLQQIICGHVTDEDGKHIRIPSNRAAEALAAAEQASGKVVLWARFHEDIDILMEAFADWNPVQYDGRVPNEQRKANKRRFISDPNCGAFIANQEAGAVGTDGLQHAAHTMIFYSNTFKAYYRWQAESRLWRDGASGTVNIVDLTAKGTMDGYIAKALANRQDIAELALSMTAADFGTAS